MHDQVMEVKKDNKSKKAVIVLSGYVSVWNSESTFSATKFIEKFNELKEAYNAIHIDIINFYGGSITEGIPIYNAIKEAADSGEYKITGKIEGLAASMGCNIAMAIPVDHLEMGNMARLMIHQAKSGAYGTAAELRNAADIVEGYEEDMVSILADRTSMTNKQVRDKWMNGLDHYINSNEAKKLNLVGKISNSETIKKAPPKNPKSPDQVYEFYNQQIVNQFNTDTNMEMEAQLRGLLNLDKGADVVQAVKDLKLKSEKFEADLTAVNNQVKEGQKNEATALVQKLVDGKRITEEQKQTWMSLFEAGHESAKKAAEALLATQTPQAATQAATSQAVTQALAFTQSAGPVQTTQTKDWDWYEKNDPSGLMALKTSDPAQFQKLFDEKYK